MLVLTARCCLGPLAFLLFLAAQASGSTIAVPTTSATGTQMVCSTTTTNGSAISCTISAVSGQRIHLTGFAVTGWANCSVSTGTVQISGTAATIEYQFSLAPKDAGDVTTEQLLVGFPVPPSGSPSITITVPAMAGAGEVALSVYGASY